MTSRSKFSLTDEEVRCVVGCKTEVEFLNKYKLATDKPTDDPIAWIPRAHNIWSHRNLDYFQDRLKGLEEKKKVIAVKRGESLPDVGGLLVDVLNELRLLNRRIDEFGNMKETLAAVRDIHDLMLRVAAQNREMKKQ
jgi:hypothetical protein